MASHSSTAPGPALYAAATSGRLPLNIASRLPRKRTPAMMLVWGSNGFCPGAKWDGSTCMSPKAPAEDTASGLPPDSWYTMLSTKGTDTHGCPCERAQ